jgi:regulator-associated protein of mTOR
VWFIEQNINCTQQTETDEPGSIQYNYQVWRQQRNDRVIRETASQSEVAR